MKYKNYIKLAALLPLLALFGCEAEETPGTESQETVPVTIRLGLENEGLSTRADGEHHTDAINEESKINSLDIYILNEDDEVEAQLDLATDFSNNQESSATVQLTTGRKQIYAIANLPIEPDELELGAIRTNPSVDAISVITEEHQYIPMSADTTWNVTTGLSTYTVNLIRMVAKMQVSIIDERESTIQNRANEGETNHTLTIESLLPHETNLFREAHGEIKLPDEISFNAWDWDVIEYTTYEEELHAHSGHFYLHESRPNETDVFNLILKDGEKERKGSFSAEIYRNHYFPLYIYLTDYRLDFSGSSYQHGPIGVIKNPTIDGYDIELPEGASAVNLKFKLVNADGTTMNATWTYTLEQEGTLPTLELEEPLTPDENGVLTVLDNYNFPAGLRGIITLTLTATFTDEGETKTQQFPVTINVRPIQDGDATRSATPEPHPIIVEL